MNHYPSAHIICSCNSSAPVPPYSTGQHYSTSQTGAARFGGGQMQQFDYLSSADASATGRLAAPTVLYRPEESTANWGDLGPLQCEPPKEFQAYPLGPDDDVSAGVPPPQPFVVNLTPNRASPYLQQYQPPLQQQQQQQQQTLGLLGDEAFKASLLKTTWILFEVCRL
ncbi:unnamed protein product [Protopolystoma xenopodis]|uniref:Uncharacterized protein n=1 Tax=Protopolystoma xenopodis TaxID=117903 RepID=A0A3S5CEB4_9PLAT|nr:unnamed protein product [Protopolystoma xenopodis]